MPRYMPRETESRSTERLGEYPFHAQFAQRCEDFADPCVQWHLRMAREAEKAGDPLEAKCQRNLADDRRADLARKARARKAVRR